MKTGITAHHIRGFRPSINAMNNLGFSAQQCLAGTGIDECDLDAPDGFSTWEQEVRFYQNLIDLAKDPCLGLAIAQAHPLAVYGLFGYAILSAPSFRHVLSIVESYVDLTYTICDFRFEVKGGRGILEIRPKYPINPALTNLLCDRDVGCCYVGFSEALGEPVQLEEIHLAHDGAGQQQRYKQFFNCPVHFEQNVNRVIFDAKLLDRQLPMRDFHATAICEQQCQLMLARLGSQGSFIEELRQKILAKPGHSFPEIETLSEQLNMSVRTLRRRLSEQGTSYRNILDGIRFDLAKEYLSQSKLSLDMISELLGYHDAASFSHAFKRWSKGQTPSGWRREWAQSTTP